MYGLPRPAEMLDEHHELSIAFGTARGITVAIAGLTMAASGIVLGWRAFAVGLIILLWGALDTSFRRRNPARGSTLPLIWDATIIGATVLLGGPWPTFIVASSAYLLTASILLLGAPGVALLTIYTAAWFALAHQSSPDLLAFARQNEVLDYGVPLLILAVTGIMLANAARTLRKVRSREKEILQRELEAGRIKDQFVSMVSHELRTPITSVAGFAETLQDGWQVLQPAEVEEFLGIIAEQAIHLSQLVEDILVIPRLEAGKLTFVNEPFELQPLVHRMVDLLFPPGGSKEASVSLPGGVEVVGDPRRVRQVLRNLIENARKYGGSQVSIHGEMRSSHYIVIVADDGRGIREEDRQRVFDHFEQVQKGDSRVESGIGLGLPISRHLVRGMGGDLWYEPGLPTGSRFCFSLPLPERVPSLEPSISQTN